MAGVTVVNLCVSRQQRHHELAVQIPSIETTTPPAEGAGLKLEQLKRLLWLC